MDIFTLNRTVVTLEALILAKGYVDAEVSIRIEDPTHKSYNRRLAISVSYNHSTEWRTREDKSFHLDNNVGLQDAEDVVTDATNFVHNLPSVQDAAGAHTLRSTETLIADMRTLAITSDTQELRDHYTSLADNLQESLPVTNNLRFHAGYHITDQS